MRYQTVSRLAVWALSPLLMFGCSDDGGDVDPTLSPTLPTNPTQVGPTTGVGTSTGQPTTDPTPTTEGGVTDGTDSGLTGTSDPTSTTVNPSDPSTDSTDGTTDDTTDGMTDGTTMPMAMCTEADCPMGQFCDVDTGVCLPGCNEDLDCMGGTVCDVPAKVCTGCISDANCGLGTVCEAGTCVPGCNDMQPCQDGLACCDGQCFDLLTDPLHCGGCSACPVPPNAAAACTMGACGLGTCEGDFNDCDNDPANGCEIDGSCLCTPGEKIACYSGPDGSQDKGICKAGLQTCNAQGTGYGACEGEILPNDVDVCANNIDDNCNGVKDEDPDGDGDGFTVCGGDCCDAVGPSCLNPNLVNPGAFEFVGNMVDDDCDAKIDNVLAGCDANLASNSNTATDYAKAIDLCQTTPENAPLAMKKWGVISASLGRASGAEAHAPNAKSIRPGFGTGGIVPKQNKRLAVLSTGNAADFDDVDPPYADFQNGLDNMANSDAPATWLMANGGKFPNAPGCPGANSTKANNSIMLSIKVRVPTNAKSFSVQMYFMSAEWPEWTCTQYNDMFVTLLNSTGAGNPADKNIAIYSVNNQKYPVGVNLVKAAPGLFTQCQNGPFGCAGNDEGTYNGCTGTGQLAGTGMHIDEGGCEANDLTGGGTGWLKMSGNVKGGETMDIRFAIWDTSDAAYDSLVLLDDWVWSVQASQPGVKPN